MLDLEGPALQPAEAALLQNPLVGGIILFARNYAGPGQLQELTATVRELRGDMLIAVDQEGGAVQRFRGGQNSDNGQGGTDRFPPLPTLYTLAQAADQQLLSDCAWAMAAELLYHGLDFSFAPVLDLYNPASRVIGKRAFAATAAEAVPLARAYIQGMHEAGMAATGKHYPGHGTVAADSHHELPVDRRSREEILQTDYRVFAECIDLLQGIMPAHVVYPAVDEVCAGFSSVWLQQLLRGELGFDGAVFSDDLSMAAAKGDPAMPRSKPRPIEARAEAALEAGCDMLLVCNEPGDAANLVEWLEGQSDAALKTRLRDSRRRQLKMTARPAADDSAKIDDLYQSERWQRARQSLQSV